MRIWLFIALTLFSAIPFSPRAARADDAAVTAQLEQILDAYVKKRGAIEGLSGAALQVDRGAGHPILAVYAGDNGLSDKKPIGPDTLFDIGSNTKEFTAALILKLEAAGKLRLDDTIGRWLPQYPAWKNVTIRSLLQMTSPIPNYSETVAIGEIEVADIHRQFSDKDLIGFVDPARWTLLHGDDDAVRELAAALGVGYRPDGQGGFDHAAVISLIDEKGEIVVQQRGTQASSDELLAALNSLLEKRN